MNRTKHAIAVSLFASMKIGARHYTKARPDTILNLLEKYHSVSIKRRWLFACLRYMEDAGYIRRKMRWRNEEGGQITQISSLFAFTIHGIKYLVSKKVSGAYQVFKTMLAYLTGKDKRWPSSNDIYPTLTDEDIRNNKAKLKQLISILE